MTIKTDAPHWSLWSIDQRIAATTLPTEPSRPRGEWRGLWELSETVGSKKRKQILGHLEIHHIPQGNKVLLEISHKVPGVQGMSVSSEISLTCKSNDWLRPESWVSETISHSGRSDMANTRSSQAGRVSRSDLRIESLDETLYPLPKRVDLTSSFSLLAALPRLHSRESGRLEFATIEELMILRTEQILERIHAVELATAAGPVSLQGYRHYGRGTPPVHYWLGPRGLPLFIASLGSALLALEFEDLGEAP